LTQYKAKRVLLGPQRPGSNLPAAVEQLSLDDGPIAVISAGWQEAEGDIDEVAELVGRPLHDVGLYRRTEELFATHHDLHDAYRSRQERLKEQQRLYRLRLRHLMVATRQVMRSEGDRVVLAAEQRHAVAQLRALDRHHRHRVETIHADFSTHFDQDNFAPIAEHATAIQDILNDCQAVLITGGNVIILLNRLLLFGLGPQLRNRQLIAWSAGAMVLSEQIVLFHDRLPDGRRDAELLGAGLGLIPGYVFLPDAGHRIRKKESLRLRVFCHRFSPNTCAMLDNESLLRFDDVELAAAEAVRRIKSNGAIGLVQAK